MWRYAGGWKKFEPLWDWVIRAKRVSQMLRILETVLGGGRREAIDAPALETTPQPAT